MSKFNSIGIAKDPKDTLVVVAMSGGVDSSTVAGIMKHEGYNVIGVTLKLYNETQETAKSKQCCAGQDIMDAKRVAEKLKIEHKILYYQDKFKKGVIDNFIDSYLNGETPIPCVQCNQTVKFNDLLKEARRLNADALVTGHYVKSITKNHKTEMYRGIDLNRDQSYFLFNTTKEQLNFLRFPLGNLLKKETIKDLEGKVVGVHDGIINYTIGQRKGIKISNKEPLYVIKIIAKTNEIIVGTKKNLIKKTIELRNLNIMTNDDKDFKKELFVKVRSTGKLIKAKINIDGESAKIDLLEYEQGIAPGQACVFYSKNNYGYKVLGGGWIKS
jgi:tRNA-specific 2-thiouridylase